MRVTTKTFVLALAALALMAGGAQARLTKGRPVQTGQTDSYGLGSDGDLQKGLSPMFSDQFNGVIKDQRTGLFWEKKSDDGSIHDRDNFFTWGQNVNPFSLMNGTMVTMFLATLNTQPCFGGFCDWRIPNRKELETLIDLGAGVPSTFPAFNSGCTPGCSAYRVLPLLWNGCSCTVNASYWSSSTFQIDPSSAWQVYFTNGMSVFGDKTNSALVRAVRGGTSCVIC
jgi:Protein of unknown function (DUF1566)